MSEAIFRERLQAIIDWADLAMRNREEFNSHGVRNLDGPVFDAAREALAITPPPASDVEPSISAIMEQAQVFASTYSLVGGRFDDGSKMAQSNEEKADLERMIRAALNSETSHEK